MTYKKKDKNYYLRLFETFYDRPELVLKVLDFPKGKIEEVIKEYSIELDPNRFEKDIDINDPNFDLVYAVWHKKLYNKTSDEDIELIYQRIRRDYPELKLLLTDQFEEEAKKLDFIQETKILFKIKTYNQIFFRLCTNQFFRDVRQFPHWDKKINDYLKGLEKDMKEFIDNGYIFSSDESSGVFSFSKDSLNYSTIRINKTYNVLKSVLNEPDSDELFTYLIDFLGKKRGYQLKEAWAFDQFLQNKI